MQDLLKAQRIGAHRAGITARPAPRRARRRQPARSQSILNRGLSRREGFPARVAGFFPALFQRNRYLLVTALSLLFLAATGLVFSLTLQKTIPRAAAPAAAAGQTSEPDLSLQALAAAYDELGSGTRAFVRDRDVEYVLQEGDSLYSIGKLYVIKAQELRDFNKISDPNRLRVGSTITIPSKASLGKFLKEQETQRLASRGRRPASLPLPASLLPPQVAISAVTVKDGPLVKAEFKVDTPLPEAGIVYFWDLGDGSVSRAKTVSATYLNPGTYHVNLTVRDKYGYEQNANTITLEVAAAEGANVVRTIFLTVGAVGDVFALAGKVVQVEDFLGRMEKPVQFMEERDGNYFYKAAAPGNFSLIARGGETVYKVYLFISPFPSVHNDRFDVDWYRTQYNTGSSNCGPASVSMAVGWAKGDFVSVTAVRNYLGYQGDGGTSFPQLERALAWRGVATRTVDITSLEEVFSVIDRGEIAIILFHTAQISKVRGRADANYVGRYYADRVGHYVIVKGYTTDRKYFVVYDPLPSDWASNGTRYGDGLSMIGRNRYYSVTEMARALSLPRMLVVSR